MKWVTIKPVVAQRVNKAANRNQEIMDLLETPIVLRAQRYFAELPEEARLPRSVLQFLGRGYRRFPTR
jgi:hypothetical protein